MPTRQVGSLSIDASSRLLDVAPSIARTSADWKART
jgi:hypothetical protein